MLKKFFEVLFLTAVLISTSFSTTYAQKVYIDEIADSGTKIYVDDSSIFGERNKFTVRMYFDDKPALAIFSAKGFLAMAIVGGQSMMVNGNPILEKVFHFCQNLL